MRESFHVMDKQRLKLIVKNLKLLIESLESEILSDPESYIKDNPSHEIADYDDDGYPD